MTLPNGFWDSSALIPLCVAQPQSHLAEDLYARYGIVVWWATEVEIRSGLTRLRRMGSIPLSQFISGKLLAEKLSASWLAVHESRSITNKACSLLELYPLSAADALQLSAALEACEHEPRGHVFITGDQRLADAARSVGFTVEFV